MMEMNFNPAVAHIVYASDDRFVEILGVSMISLFENSRNLEDIVVYILDSGIKKENKLRIESICKTYKRRMPIWIVARNIRKELGISVELDRGSMSQYARLFISSVLPEGLEKVLYLDCDIVIKQSIRELWGLNMHGKTIAALNDAFSKYYRANIGLKQEDIMFNSGVMLIDLKRWKKYRIEEKLLKFISEHKGRIQQGDQGALNAVLSHDTYCFEPKFNSITIFYDFDYQEMLTYRKPPNFYSERQVKEAIEYPVLIHFTTSFLSKRPWYEGCHHRYVGEWLKYKALSPWKDEPLWTYEISKWKKNALALYKKLPRKFSVGVVGILQAYARPFWVRVKNTTLDI